MWNIAGHILLFIDTFHGSIVPEQCNFANAQEAAWKNIERCFGVLNQRFHILACPLRNYYWDDIVDLLDCCIILHNMDVEHRRPHFAVGHHAVALTEAFNLNNNDPPPVTLFGQDNGTEAIEGLNPVERRSMAIAQLSERMMDAVEHNSLKHDLVEHCWARKNRY